MKKRIVVIVVLILLSFIIVACGKSEDSFTKENQHYTVTFKNYDDSILKSELVKKGENATPPVNPTRMSTNEYQYTFVKWVGNYLKVDKNEIVIANFDAKVREYTVRFLNPDGNTLSSNIVLFGGSVVPPTNPRMEDHDNYTYKFVDWIGNYNAVTNDMDIIAKYDKYKTIQLTKENYKDYFLIEEDIINDYREEYTNPFQMLKIERHTKISIRPLIKIDSFLNVSIKFINDTFTGAYTVPGNQKVYRWNAGSGNLQISHDGSGSVVLVAYYNSNKEYLQPMKYAIEVIEGNILVKEE